MGKQAASPPPAPNPYAVSAAQTGSNVQTAIANTIMGNANETSPYGSVRYNRIGTTRIGAPATASTGSPTPGSADWLKAAAYGGSMGSAFGTGGEGYDIPQYERVVTLSPEQQRLYNQQTRLGSDMNSLAIDQTGRLRDTLGSPINADGLPNAGRMPTAPNLQTNINLGQASTGFADAGNVQRNVNLGQASGSFADAGNIQRNVNLGQASTGFADAGNIQRGFGDVGNIQRSVGPTDYSADRQRVEQALLSRINPELDRDRAALETRLVNQGFARGSDAFRTEMDSANRSATDARMQAILAGGNEQSRLAGIALQSGQFANNAQAQAYGQEQGRGQFANAAQGQAFGQAQARGQFANDALAQNNTAALQSGNFANTAQGQAYGQAQGRGQFANAATEQNNAAALQSGSFANAAQGQEFGQAQTRGQFGNDAIAQNNAAALTGAQFGNTARQQGFGNELSLAQAQDTQRERGLQERLALRNQPINEISALMNGGQVTAPQFAPYQGGSMAPTDIGGMIYNSAALNNQNYKTQMDQSNAAMGGMFGLGSAALMGALAPATDGASLMGGLFRR